VLLNFSQIYGRADGSLTSLCCCCCSAFDQKDSPRNNRMITSSKSGAQVILGWGIHALEPSHQKCTLLRWFELHKAPLSW
jgi:hypothetical protein